MTSPGIEPWIDLLAATLAGPRLPGPAVVLHAAQRSMPLLEQSMPTAFVHAGAAMWHDFSPAPPAHPLRRERIDALQAPEEAAALLGRAGLRVLAVPDDAATGALFAGLVAKLPAASPSGAAAVSPTGPPAEGADPSLWIVHGPADAAGWPALAEVVARAGLVELAAPGFRLLVSPAMLMPLEVLGLGAKGLQPALARRLAAELPEAFNAHVALDTPTGRPRLRLRPDPLWSIATPLALHAHRIVAEERAMFSPRGVASLLLPWDGCAHVRLLLRHATGPIDDVSLNIGSQRLAPDTLAGTDHGFLLGAWLPPFAPDRETLLHIALPRRVLPAWGPCDVAATEFSIDLA